MSSNDGLNLFAIVAGVRAIVDAVDAALELYHRLPLHIDDAGQLEVGDRVTLGANLESWSHRWALGAWIGGTIREATGHTLEARAALGPLGVFITYDGGDEDDPQPDVLDLDEDPFPGRITLADDEVAALRDHLETLAAGAR